MSLPKRHIEIDPSTPFEEVTKFLGEGSGEVEVKSGPELFIVHRATEEELGASPEPVKPNAVDAMLEFAGSWADNEAIDDFLEWREKQRELDIERQERLWGKATTPD